MSKIDWMKKLNWNEEHLEDLRFAGYAYIRQGKYDIALKIFKALCVLSGGDAYDNQTLGALYLEINEPKEALVHLDRALKVEADHAPTLLNMSKALFMIGKHDEGVKLAKILSKEGNPKVSSTAKALMLAFE